MKVQSFKSIMLVTICVWGVTGAVAFWAGNKFGTNGKLVASASDGSKGDKDALQRALEKAVMAHSGSTKDPGAPATEQLLAFKGKLDPAQLARWAASLSPGDCAKVMADLQKLPAGAKRDAMLGALYDSWAKQDPQGFLTNVGKMTNPTARAAGTAKALNAWAMQDPKAALAWLDKNPGTTGALQAQQFNAIMAGFAANNPDEAYKYVTDMPDGATPNSAQAQAKIAAMQAVISGMADQGKFTDILAMVGQLPPNSQIQMQAYQSMLAQWATNSPADAAQWVAGLDRTQFPQARQYASQLVQNWAASDPVGAAQWAAAQDAANAANATGGRAGRGGNLLATAVGQMVADGDVDQAGTYLNTLQAGPEKDSAVAAYITGAASQDPAGAMVWAQTISDPNTQNRMTMTVAYTWNQEDPTGFANYLGTLPPATAQQLQAAAAGGGFGFGRGGRGQGGGFQAGGFQGGGFQGGGFQGGNGAVNNGTGQGGPSVTLGNGAQAGRGGRRGGRGGGGGGG